MKILVVPALMRISGNHIAAKKTWDFPPLFEDVGDFLGSFEF
jgi:hypothetical protein